jgi:hypothetical protein
MTTTTSQITPSVGRKVWYYANSNQAEPWDATIVKVHDLPTDASPFSAVNLNVIDPDTGHHLFRPAIAWHDESQQWPGEHFRWMPYQTASAAAAPAPAPAPEVAAAPVEAPAPAPAAEPAPAPEGTATDPAAATA